MSRKADERPLTLGRAAVRYGYPKSQNGRRAFKTMLERAERELGKPIIDRRGGPPFYVYPSVIAKFVPELAGVDQEMTIATHLRDDMHDYVKQIDTKLDERISEHQEIATLRRRMFELEKRLNLLVGAPVSDYD